MKKILLYLLRKFYQLDLVLLPLVPSDVLTLAKNLCGQVDTQATSGEHKRGQVMRALMNRFPTTKERVLAAAIEIAICSE